MVILDQRISMKTLFALSFMFFVLMQASLSFAGGSDGGGGKAVVCYFFDRPDKIANVELLDLYEGKILENLKINDDYDREPTEILNAVLDKAHFQEQDVRSMIASIHLGFHYLGRGVRLKPIGDSNEIFIPANCKIEQIANFQGLSRIFVVKDFWDFLPQSHKAALMLHEALWYIERSAGSYSSSRARRSVARFFSEDFIFTPVDYSPESADYECTTKAKTGSFFNNSFTLEKVTGDICKLNFRTLNGAYVFTRVSGEIDKCSEFITPSRTDKFPKKREIVVSELNVWTTGTHRLKLGVYLDDSEGAVKIKQSIAVENLEFPNYNEDQVELICRPIVKN